MMQVCPRRQIGRCFRQNDWRTRLWLLAGTNCEGALMKKVFLIGIFCFFFMTSLAYAHPPTKIDVNYDPATKILAATIFHSVQNPLRHFTIKVDVSINGKEILLHQISQQETKDTQTVSYKLTDVKKGDILEVEAYCNISGKKAEKIQVK
jgi:hypothetical protein